MSQNGLLDAINTIREKAEKGKLIIFVGAGVSCNVDGMPSWEELVKSMATAVSYSKCNHCRQVTKNCKKTCLLKDTFSTDEFLKIPQYLFNTSKKKYYEIFKNNFKKIDADAPLSKLIFELNPAHIITTNYDNLLESSSSELRQQYQVIIEDKDLLNTHASKYIIKMHGDLENIESIVLKEQDYLDFSQKKVLIELFVKALLTDHTILFLGYSLNDYNIKLIISWLNYMRQQNGALKGKTVGYMVLDSVRLNKTQKKYFEQNSIDVVNLHGMPLIKNIPASLKHDVGRRLYSFLKVIESPKYMNVFELKDFLHDVVLKIGSKPFIAYKELLSILQANYFQKHDNTLEMRSEGDYNYLKGICEENSVDAKQIKQHLINNGIYFLSFFKHDKGTQCYAVAEYEECTLFNDEVYVLYLQNNFVAIEELSVKENSIMKKCFYQQFYSFYNPMMVKEYDELDFKGLSESNKLGYLYNKALLDFWSTFIYSLKNMSNYYNAIPSREQKQLLSLYKESTDGFQDRKVLINEKLNKLIDLYSANTFSFSGTLGHFYEIKDSAIELYKFHFYNNLFCERRDDLKKVLRLYIEAMICTNGEYGKQSVSFMGASNELERYALDRLDLDIIIRFISTKDLLSLIKKYHVKNIKIDVDIDHITNSLKNLIASIDIATMTNYSSFWSCITNYLALLTYIELNEEESHQIEILVLELLSTDKFLRFFFSEQYPDFRECLNLLNNLCTKFIKTNQINIVKKIILSENFFDYLSTAGEWVVKAIFSALLIGAKEEKIQMEAFSIIEQETSVERRIKLIWLLQKAIINQNYKEKLKTILEENFVKIKGNYLIDFVVSDWLMLNSEKIKHLVNTIIELDKRKSENQIIHFPDPFERALEVLCILIVFGKIDDISVLYQVKNKTPYLEFLLYPNNFDYNKVDFSDYMWSNFANNSRLRKFFIEHKDEIIPRIKDHIKLDVVNEIERKLLYGYLLAKEEILGE